MPILKKIINRFGIFIIFTRFKYIQGNLYISQGYIILLPIEIIYLILYIHKSKMGMDNFSIFTVNFIVSSFLFFDNVKKY